MTLARTPPGLGALAEVDRLGAAAVEQHVTHVLGELGPRRLDVEAVVSAERLDQMEVMLVAPVPAAHRAARERQVRMQYHTLRIEELLDPEAVARGAGAGGIVE